MVASRDGQRVARLFRQYRSLGDTRRCDLDKILGDDELEVVESRCPNPGFTACLMRAPYDEPGGLIILAPGQPNGRRRFSVAHELGHYHIPRHRALAKPPCTEGDMRMREGDSIQVEWEANDFAAELLMPRRLFSSDADRRSPSFSSVYELASASYYDVSVTAAAWRFVQTTRESCALVVLKDGVVEWVARSRSFRYGVAERHQRVREGTIAAEVLGGESSIPDALPVETHAWFDDRCDNAKLLESTHEVESTGQLLSMLWCVEAEEEDE